MKSAVQQSIMEFQTCSDDDFRTTNITAIVATYIDIYLMHFPNLHLFVATSHAVMHFQNTLKTFYCILKLTNKEPDEIPFPFFHVMKC